LSDQLALLLLYPPDLIQSDYLRELFDGFQRQTWDRITPKNGFGQQPAALPARHKARPIIALEAVGSAAKAHSFHAWAARRLA